LKKLDGDEITEVDRDIAKNYDNVSEENNRPFTTMNIRDNPILEKESLLIEDNPFPEKPENLENEENSNLITEKKI
jgi:hypothetical protein